VTSSSGKVAGRAVLSRRDLLRSAALPAMLSIFPSLGKSNEVPSDRAALLDEIERRACTYFLENAHPVTGLVLDRARTAGNEDRRVASIAATGFGLSALCIAHRKGMISEADAKKRVESTLDFFANKAFHQRGFYFHFIDWQTGRRAFHSEVSSIDTAWLLCGILQARQHFGGGRIQRLTREILDRVDWRWMCAGGETLCHGWTPEKEFLPYRWDQYSELLAMYLLALGSNTHSIPVSSWDAWERPRNILNDGGFLIQSPAPLFVHQYSHAWMDFRNVQDGYADYFHNSKLATLAHRSFCLGMRDRFPWFGDDMWGITASDSKYGYLDWGGPLTKANSRIDGTLVPCAAGGSLVFLPDECSRVLETMLSRYGKQVWTRYGFVDAFQPEMKWQSADVIGIDLGIMLLMAENMQTGSVWQEMMSAPEITRGFKAAGFFTA
jgi:hypothetical protein